MIAVVGGAIGAALFLLVLGPAIVDPSNLGWTMRHDLQTYVLAFTHFRHEPWTWPPGLIQGVGYPIGTSIGNADAVPIAAFALKPLEWLLPAPGQFLGAWLLLCYVLQGVFGVLLTRLATTDWRLQLLGAALLVQVPALIGRGGHPALSAHWLLLASLWLLIAEQRAPRPWHRAGWLIVAVVVAATQPYLAAMVLPLALAAVANRAWRRQGTAPLRTLLVDGGAVLVAMVAVFWLCGIFIFSSVDALQFEGVGLLSMNLLGPITSQGFSILLPDVPMAKPGQYEGHVYFGVGWLLMTAVAMVLAVRHREALPRLGVGWLAVLACTLMALSPVVTLGRATLVDLSAWAPASLAMFRSSGRFGWVTMYTAFAVATLVIASRLPRRAALGVFTAAALLQAVDLSGAYRAIHAREQSPEWTDYVSPIPSPAWQTIVPAYRHLVMLPPDMCATVWAPVAGPHLPFSLLAGTHGVTLNSGNSGRYDFRAVLRYCAETEAGLRAGRVDAESIYVLSPAMRAVLGAVATSVPMACGTLDGFDVCVSAATVGRWREAARRDGFEMTPLLPGSAR